MASLANCTVRMPILHSARTAEYYCKTSGILFNCDLSISEEASYLNFRLVASIVIGRGAFICKSAWTASEGCGIGSDNSGAGTS